MKITFVLPGGGSSGGVRVTVIMANLLLNLGHNIRIAYRIPAILSKARFKLILNKIISRMLKKSKDTNWLDDFNGILDKFTDLQKLKFEDGEIVIAVGTFTITDVYKLKDNVIKIRYCHGYDLTNMELTRSAWGVSMPTIAVSSTLNQMHEELCNEQIREIIPNGIDTNDYYQDNYKKNGIGIIYGAPKIKDPETIIKLLKCIHQKWEDIPLYIFGAYEKPAELDFLKYHKFPTIVKARELYSRSKIWLVASKSEGFSVPILEAMACGAAIISTDTFGGRELIKHGINGYLVPVGDIDSFMKYIELLLNNEELRQQIIKSGFETVKNFTWENAVIKMNMFLKKIAAE
jgi:glycosyltransferase involved in cell wall biosynthesis